jgi:hypothetical protein
MPARGLTVDWKEKPRAYGFLSISGRAAASPDGQRQVFHKIYVSRLIDSRSLRPRPFFLRAGS